jgi:hypothetical protein
MNIIVLPKTPHLKKEDFILFFLYLTFIITLVYCAKLIPSFRDEYGFVFRIIGFAYPFLLVGLYTKQLRHNIIFLAWFFVGILQLILILYFPEYDEYGDNVLFPLRGLFFTTLAVRISHSISFMMYKFPFVATNNANYTGMRDYKDKRKIQSSDFLFTIATALVGIFSVTSF